MRKLRAMFFIVILFCSLTSAFADKPALPSTSQSVPALTKNQQEGEGFDIVLLMDSSGSMKKTDPQNYRKAAARLFISLFGSDDRIGVISFGDSSKTLIGLTQNSGKNRERLLSAIGKISSREFATNITDGVKRGFDEIKPSQRKNRILLLMSDGKLALGSKEKDEAAFKELSGLLPELAKSNIKIYSVAFTESSDVQLLENMAKETKGFFKLAKTDRDIYSTFASMFEKIKSPDTIPIEGDAFSVDKDIKEAIVLVSKKAGTTTAIVDPSGNKYSPARFAKNIQWYEAKVFDMITIKDPAVGKWKVNLSVKEGNRVFIITNLNLKSSFDKSFVHKNDRIKIDAWLQKDGGMLKEKDVLEQISFFAEIAGPDGKSARLDLKDSGESGDDKAGDGIYSNEFIIASDGEYTVKIIAESKTFKREKVCQIKASEPAAAQPAEQKKEPVQAAKKTPASEGALWKTVLIKFGIINVSLLVIILVVFLINKEARKKSDKKGKRKGGAPKKS